jgi:hypothetical protein
MKHISSIDATQSDFVKFSEEATASGGWLLINAKTGSMWASEDPTKFIEVIKKNDISKDIES